MALSLSTTTFQREATFVTSILGAADRSMVNAISSDGTSLTTQALYIFDASRRPLQVGWLLTGRYRSTGSPTISLTEYPFRGGAPVTTAVAATVQTGAVSGVTLGTFVSPGGGVFYTFVNGIEATSKVNATSSDGISISAREAFVYDNGRKVVGTVQTGVLRFGGTPTATLMINTGGVMTTASGVIDAGAAPAGVMRVVLVAGQSNSVGRYPPSARDTAELVGITRVKQYPDIAADSGTYRIIRDSVFPLYFPENTIASNYISPANRAGALIAAANPADTIVLIPVAWGSTTLVTTNGSGTSGPPQWIEPTGNLNVAAVAQVNAFMAANPTAVMHSILWIQGENDAGGVTAATQQQYHDGLQALINGWRTRITGNSTAVPFIMGSMTPGFIALDADAAGIVAAQKALATELANVRYVDAAATLDDTLHYTHNGINSIGVAMGLSALNSAPGVIFSDDFTAADTAALTTLDWINRTGTGSSIWQNKAIFASNTVSDAPIQIFNATDYAITVALNFVNTGTHYIGLRARAAGSSSMTGYMMRATCTTAAGGTINWEIRRFDSTSSTGAGINIGTYTETGVGTGTNNFNRTATFDLRGSTLRAIIDGVERINVTDATYQTQRAAQGLLGSGGTTTNYIGVDSYVATTAVIP